MRTLISAGIGGAGGVFAGAAAAYTPGAYSTLSLASALREWGGDSAGRLLELGKKAVAKSAAAAQNAAHTAADALATGARVVKGAVEGAVEEAGPALRASRTTFGSNLGNAGEVLGDAAKGAVKGAKEALGVRVQGPVQGGAGPRTVVAGEIPGAVKPPQHVLFDTDAVRYLQGYVNRGAALPEGVLNAGEAAALPETVVEQLARQTARGRLAPRIASDLPVVPDGQSALLRSDVARTMREFSVRYGRLEGDVAADAAIGGTALERGLPLVTGDTDLHRALKALGVDARLLRMITR